MPEFGTLLRSQRTLAVNSPYRGPNGPLHLMIDSTASRSGVRASGTHASMGRITGPGGGSGTRDILGSMSKLWRFRPSRSLGVIPVLPRCCRICSTRSRRTQPSEASLQMVLSIPVNTTTPSLTAGRMPSSPLQKTPSRGRLFLRVPDPEARPGELRNTSAARSGETGLDITGDAVSRPRCTALNCWINASWHGTSTNSGCDKNPIQLFMLVQARTSKVPIKLLTDLLFVPLA